MQEEYDAKSMKSCNTVCEQCLQKMFNVPHQCKICNNEFKFNGAIIYESKNYNEQAYERDNPSFLCFLIAVPIMAFAFMIYYGQNCHC